MKDALATLRQQLQQLKQLHEGGTLDAAAYAAAKAPLERKLLDHVLNAPGATAPQAPTPRPTPKLLGALTAAVLALAGAGYWWTGSPGMASAGAPGSATTASANAAPHSMDDAAFAEAVDKLALRLKEEPDNAEGWSMLARSYARLGRHADAAPAFEKAVALQHGDASLLADYADTLAMLNGRVLEGAPMQMVERALKIEPDNAKALALAGTAAFNRKDYATAVRQWERLAQVSPPEAAFMPQLQSSIDEARKLAGMPPGTPVARAAAAEPPAAAPPVANDAPANDAPANGAATAQVSGSLRLSPALAKLAAPTDTVFIYARPAEGSRMPLAIQRHQVKDLPLDFKLDDSMAMSPAAKMSLFPKLIISARVSKTGQAMATPGDLTGQSAPVANVSKGLVVEINEVVKN